MLPVEETDVFEVGHDYFPVSGDGDAFNPLADTASAMTGNDLDPEQTEPEPGSVVELGGQDVNATTLSIATGKATAATQQNLSGQSDSPPLFDGDSQQGAVSGSGSAASSVNTGSHDGDTVILSAMHSLGGSLATGIFGRSPQQVTSPQTAGANQTVLVQTKESGLSFAANVVLFAVLGVALYFVVEAL
jgi:hypothetical protein